MPSSPSLFIWLNMWPFEEVYEVFALALDLRFGAGAVIDGESVVEICHLHRYHSCIPAASLHATLDERVTVLIDTPSPEVCIKPQYSVGQPFQYELTYNAEFDATIAFFHHIMRVAYVGNSSSSATRIFDQTAQSGFGTADQILDYSPAPSLLRGAGNAAIADVMHGVYQSLFDQ